MADPPHDVHEKEVAEGATWTVATGSRGRRAPAQAAPTLTISPATGSADADISFDQAALVNDNDDAHSTASSRKSDRTPIRGASPPRLSAQLTLKARSQLSRIKAIRGYHNILMLDKTLEASHAKSILKSAEEVHKAFNQEHAYLEVSWPISHLDHPYFEDDQLALEADLMGTLRKMAAKFLDKSAAAEAQSSQGRESPRDQTATLAKLPRLTLKTFDGEYSEWPSFCDLFKSMVISNPALNDLERLYYLKLSVTKSASDLISHVPLTDHAFANAWKALEERFGNHRVLVDSQLSKLAHEHSGTDRQRESAGFLQQLITGIDSALNTLRLIGQSTENWDCLIVYNTVRQFSPRTRELWEASISQLTLYPSYEQLKEFITQRARTLEQTEAARHSTSGPPARATSSSSQGAIPKTSHHASVSHSPSTALTQRFQCDCCSEQHFIASCSEFVALPDQDKKEVVIQRRLCHNCLGRHNTSDCRGRTKCKTCNLWHHTLLHGAISAKNLPASTRKVEPRKFQASSSTTQTRQH